MIHTFQEPFRVWSASDPKHDIVLNLPSPTADEHLFCRSRRERSTDAALSP